MKTSPLLSFLPGCVNAPLAALPPSRVISLAERLVVEKSLRVDPVPRQGLRLLPLRESTAGEIFYLGEVPLAEAQVFLEAPDGQTLHGGAAVMDGTPEQAEAIAVLDALLMSEHDGAGEIAALAAEGQGVLDRQASERSHMRARTRVNFSLLSDADGEEG